jgi:hypothetical protein
MDPGLFSIIRYAQDEPSAHFTNVIRLVKTCPPASMRTSYTPVVRPEASKVTRWRPADIVPLTSTATSLPRRS